MSVIIEDNSFSEINVDEIALIILCMYFHIIMIQIFKKIYELTKFLNTCGRPNM